MLALRIGRESKMAKIMRLTALFFRNQYTEKIVALLTILLFLATVSIALRSYYLNKTLFPFYEQKLNKKLKEQIVSINAFLDLNKKNADNLSEDPIILNYLQDIHQKNIISPTAQKDLHDYLTKRQDTLGFKSVSLIANNGVVEFSTNELLRNIQLNDEKYANTPLFRSYFVASMTLTPDFSDFFYSTIIKAPAFYITMPLIRNNKVLGVLAYQIEENKLNIITRDYLDLGRTGEIVLAVQSGSRATFITPTRNDPNIKFTTKELFVESGFEAMQRAAKGETGFGLNNDYQGQKTLASWSFLPRVDWAIIVKISLQEVLEPIASANKFIIIFSILTIIFTLITLFFHYQSLGKRLREIRQKIFHYVPSQIRHPEIFLLLIFVSLSTLAIYRYQQGLNSSLKKSQDEAMKEVKNGIAQINVELNKISHLADFIAQDLRTERLISEDIRKRLRREVVETPGLVRITIAYGPYRYSKKEKLYAPSITEKADSTLEEEMIGKLYDYTDKNEGFWKTRWYTKAMESQKPQWLNLSVDPVSGHRVIIYALPFFFDNEKEPAGVIAISYRLGKFWEIAQNIGVGDTGYSFILSHDQIFLYHPISKNIDEQKTLLQFAQEEGNHSLEYIAREIKENKPILKKFSDGSTRKAIWIYTEPIEITGWTIGTIFSSNEIGLPLSVIKAYIFDVIAYISITLLIVLFIFCRFYSRKPFTSFLIFSNIILAFTLICLWYIIDKASIMEKKRNVLITDQSSVNKFINTQMLEAKRKNEPTPIVVPCGIELYSLQQTSPTYVTFSGYLWHRYHKTLHKDLQRIIRIPQATSFSVLNESKISEGDWEIIGLNVTATIYNELDYTRYPFEVHQIVIPLEHADLGKNILLVPDLEAYNSISPYKRPGLDTTFSATSFYATETFFDYTPHKPNSDLGVRKYLDVSNLYRLAYNIIIDVDLFAPFIYFFLPLLVILISIFAVLMLERPGTSPYTMMGPYTGLFFALVLLDRSLHEKAPSSGTLYLEYAFFFTYIILILLVVHTMFGQRFGKRGFYQLTLVPYFKIIFWPLQLVAWIITTLIIFY